MTDISSLNALLTSIINNSNFASATSRSTDAKNASLLSISTELNKLEAQIDGIKALVDALDARTSVAKVTKDVPNLTDKLEGDVSSSASDLEKITGTAAQNGALNVTISQASPEALSVSIAKVTGEPVDTVARNISNVAPAAARGSLSNMNSIVTQGPAQATQYTKAINIANRALRDAFGRKDELGALLTELQLRQSIGYKDILEAIVIGRTLPLPEEVLFQMLFEGKIDEVAEILAPTANIPVENIKTELLRIDIQPSTITDNTSSRVGTISVPEVTIGQNESEWKDENTPLPESPSQSEAAQTAPNPNAGYNFSYVASKEELVTEFRQSTREITEVVTHWTATFTNQYIGAEEVHRWHVEKGWSGCGYHFIIKRDGKLQRGRPLNKTGAHAYANGHNHRSIGISFVGGYDCPIGTPNPQSHQSANSLTAAQFKTFDMFMNAFYLVWPRGQAWGHNDTDPNNKPDPGFSVPEYVLNKFGKTNVNSEGTTPPLTIAELATETNKATT